MAPTGETFVVAALYQFAPLPDYKEKRAGLLATCEEAGTSGTLLLASEGINGTIAGNREAVDKVLSYIRGAVGLSDIEHKESHADSNPFHRMKVRLKKEIVTMGVPDIDPTLTVGTYVAPQDWDDLIADPNTILIDTRNDYEVGIGSFKGAVNPNIKSFREFPNWLKDRMAEDPANLQNKNVAMFCTGGIRCEKSTALAKELGLTNVFHLKGGILKYLENVPEEQSSWEGECFVFDERVSVGHGLELGSYNLCRACRTPIDATAKASPLFEAGVSCHNCHGKTTEAQKAGYRERQKQAELAEHRGENHIGMKADSTDDRTHD